MIIQSIPIYAKFLIPILLVIILAGAIWLYAGPNPVTTLPFATATPSATSSATSTPTIGNTNAYPSIIIFGSPSMVTVTSEIKDVSLVTTSINLLRLDASGKSTIITKLHDDGLNGDSVAGDKTFTAQTSINSTSPEQIRLQVSAAFRGVLKRSLSNIMFITVIDGPLPPDPGEAGKQTLAGIDSDTDGIRDDIQRHIALTYPLSQKHRALFVQYVIAEQKFLLDADSEVKSVNNSIATQHAKECVISVLGTDGLDMVRLVTVKIVNTDSRHRAYLKADAKLAGYVFDISRDDQMRSRCLFNPDELPN